MPLFCHSRGLFVEFFFPQGPKVVYQKLPGTKMSIQSMVPEVHTKFNVKNPLLHRVKKPRDNLRKCSIISWIIIMPYLHSFTRGSEVQNIMYSSKSLRSSPITIVVLQETREYIHNPQCILTHCTLGISSQSLYFSCHYQKYLLLFLVCLQKEDLVSLYRDSHAVLLTSFHPPTTCIEIGLCMKQNSSYNC